MASSNDRSRSWFVSLAKRKDGDDMELKRSMILRHVAELRPSRYAATLLMTARRAGYIAVSFPPLLVIRVYIDCYQVSDTTFKFLPCPTTYLDQEIGICPLEPRNPNERRECVLSLERLVQVHAKVLFHAQRLQQEGAHAYDALLGCVAHVLKSVEEGQDNKVVGSLRVNDEGPESLVALRHFPEQHDELGREPDGRLRPGKVGGVGLQWLVEHPGQAIYDELKVLRSVEATKEVSVEVFGRCRPRLLRDWV